MMDFMELSRDTTRLRRGAQYLITRRGVRGGWKGMALTEGVERDRGMTHGGLELGLEHR